MVEIICEGCGRAMDSAHTVCPGCGKRVGADAAKAAAPMELEADDAPLTLAGDDSTGDVPEIEVPEVEVPEIDVSEPDTQGFAMSDLELPAGDPTQEALDLASRTTAAVEASEGGPSGEPEVEEPEEEPAEAPRGDTVQMSIADATKVWVEESGKAKETPAPVASPAPARSRVPLLIGLLIAAAAILAIVLAVL